MVWALIQGLGALVGLATGIFVVVERLTMHRPEMFFVSMPFADVPRANRFFYLRVRNVAARPLLLRVENGIRDGELGISKDDSIRSIVRSMLGGKSVLVINGGDEINFPLVKPPNFSGLDPGSEMALNIDWQFAQPIFWRGWRRRRLSISKRSYLDLGEIDDDDDDEE